LPPGHFSSTNAQEQQCFFHTGVVITVK
jgi:hypothetical protein